MQLAHPGTSVISISDDGREDRILTEPVIFWDMNDDKHPEPVTIEGRRILLEGDAIQFPNGTVLDVIHLDTYVSVAAWAGGALAATPSRAPEVVKTPQTAPTGGSGLPFELSGKKYSRKSFWRFDGDTSFAFILDPETNAPTGDGVTKITRDQFKSVGPDCPTIVLAEYEADAAPTVDEDDDIDGMI